MIPHWVTDAAGILAPIVGVGYLVVQLMLKASIGETNALIREHVAGDVQKHDAIDSHLEATDKRVDRLETKIY